MSKVYTVELTDVQEKVLRHIAYDPQEWIENAIFERCRKAIDEIYKKEVARMVDDPSIQNIPADKNTIIENAELKTAKEIQDEKLANNDTI